MRFLSDRVRWPFVSDRVAGGNLQLQGLDRCLSGGESPGLNRSPAFIPPMTIALRSFGEVPMCD